MPRQSFTQLPPERRRFILDVAAEEFARSGFEGTSYNKLLERLGLGKSSAYYYFENKRDLFVTVVADCYSTYFEQLGPLPRPCSREDFWDFVRDAARVGFAFMSSDPRTSAVMRCMQQSPTLLAELTSDHVLSSIARYHTELLLLGQELGAVRRDLPLEQLLDLSRLVTQATDQWFVQALGRGEPAELDVAAERYLDLVRRLLEPAPC